MPLEGGTVGSAAFKHNIKTEIAAGKSQKQAVAIAYQMAGERRGDVLALDCAKLDAVIYATMAVERRMRSYETRRHDDASWQESDHPRDEDGQFSSTGGGASSGIRESTKTVDGKRVQSNGSALPEHIAKLKIPPAWTDVKYSVDPSAGLLAIGKDAKGRRQAIYSAEFSASQAAAKFARIKALMDDFPLIEKQNAKAQRADNPKMRDAADCLMLIMEMGVRPGSEADTGAKVKAYGATTLEGRHVVRGDDDTVHLTFTGKKGVSLDLPVENKALAANLLERAKKSGPDGKLFGGVTDKGLLDYTHTLGGGGFKTKDFRTRLGTAIAHSQVQTRTPPKSEKEYRRAVMEVARAVAAKLGNTPVIALQSYIAPEVFSEWRMAA